jgi:sorbitol/mannitol transport system permease protein
MKATEVSRFAKVNSLVIPSIVLVALITQIPLLVTLGLSVIKWIVVRPDLKITFVGIGNYIQILSNPEFLKIILNTIVLTFVSIVSCTVFGLIFALLLNRQFIGVNIARTILISPFFVMDAVAGIIWKTLMLHPSFGINSVIAKLFGVNPVDFLGNYPMLTVIMLVVWQWTPFFVLIQLAGLQSIPEEIIESAKIDGAGWLRTIFQIKIPAIANHRAYLCDYRRRAGYRLDQSFVHCVSYRILSLGCRCRNRNGSCHGCADIDRNHQPVQIRAKTNQGGGSMKSLSASYNQRKIFGHLLTLLVWALCLVYFFPLLYMFMTSFKAETDAVPPKFFFTPTIENYVTVLSSGILPYLFNSMVVTIVSMVLCLLFGVPAAYAIVFGKLKDPDSVFFWFLSTTLLPAVSVIIPIFLVFKTIGALDTRWGLIIVYLGANIPIVIWMVRSFLKDIPGELLEAAEIDGASRLHAFFRIILPLAKPGIISTGLLVFIFIWNEFFFAVNLTYIHASTIPVYMATYMTQEGLFWAKLSAISTITVLPPLILGWVSQKALVRGMMMGAVKG